MSHPLILASLAAVLCSACGGAGPPVTQVAASEAAIRSAEEVGAGEDPKATLHLKLAREQYDAARALIKDGKITRARYVLQRAEADAELALVLTREVQAKEQAQALTEEVRKAQKPMLQ